MKKKVQQKEQSNKNVFGKRKIIRYDEKKQSPQTLTPDP